MAPINVETVYQTSLLHIESNLDRPGFLKKNLNASRPSSEHPPVRAKRVKTFRCDHRLQKQNLFMAFKSPMVVTLGQQYNPGEKPTVMLYTYINLHEGTPDKNKTKTFLVHH